LLRRCAALRSQGAGAATRDERIVRKVEAQIPLVPALREGGDDGHPIVVAHPDDEAAVAFRAVAERLDTDLTPKRIYRPELKINLS
jgi:ATP-binding protein involved in chromosome partitioning